MTGAITPDAGTRVARWSSMSVIANGPLPTGSRAKSLVGEVRERDVRQEVGRQERLRGQREEPADRRRRG